MDFSTVKDLIIVLVDVMLGVALVLLLLLDRLIHSRLYEYGLIFSENWARDYWALFRTSFVLIFLAFMAISLVELLYPRFQRKRQ